MNHELPSNIKKLSLSDGSLISEVVSHSNVVKGESERANVLMIWEDRLLSAKDDAPGEFITNAQKIIFFLKNSPDETIEYYSVTSGSHPLSIFYSAMTGKAVVIEN